MEHIPAPYNKENLPVAAVLISEDVGLEVTLLPIESQKDNPGERDYKTGLKIKFEGGVKYIRNRSVLRMMMQCGAYARGEIRIHPEDPTGFWRQTDVIKPETREVVISKEVPNPTYEQITEQIKDVKKTETTRALVLDES